MRRALAIAATLAAIVTALPTAAASGSSQQQLTGSLSLVAQTVFRTAEQPLPIVVRIRTSSATSGLEVAISTYRRLRTRSEFAAAVDGRLPTRTPADLQRMPLDGLATDVDGNTTVMPQPIATQEGVYPLRVELRDAETSNVIDGFTTFSVTVPAVVEADPLDVAVVLPIHAPPAVQPAGESELDASRAAALADVATSLHANSGVPLSLLPTAETLEALATSPRAADRDAVTTFARAAADRSVVAATYVPTDARALVAGGLTGEFNAQLERGITTVTNLLGTTPVADVRVLDERADAETVDTLQDQDVTRLVVAEAVLESIRPPNGITLTAHFDIAAADGPLDAAVADPGLAAHFTRDVPPILGATHLLADLAVLWLDRPGRGETRRGVVVMPPRAWEPDAAFLTTLLVGLTSNPVLAPVTLDTFFDAVGEATTRGRPLTRAFQPPQEASGLNGPSIRNARRRLEAFASVVDPENDTLDLLDRTLLVSQSSDLRAAARSRYVRGVLGQIATQLEAIEMPERRSITLTAREGELPITITNRLPYAVTVVLTLDSDALDFPDGSTRTLELARENTTERFQVHARGSGSFPVRVRVEAPQGALLLAESRFTVRSTAVSGVGIALSVGAALFLVVWWASHLRTRRRADLDAE